MADDARTRLEKAAIISLAGRIAERRAAMDGRPGWTHVALHEAAHAVVAHQLAHTVYELSVVPDPSVRLGRGHLGGYCKQGPASETPVGDHPRWSTKDLETDRRSAVKICWLLAPGYPCWKSALRCLRLLDTRARAVVNACWPKILTVAGVLEARKKLTQDEIAGILAGDGL